MHPEPSLTIGIEEEYLLVDKRTRDLAVDPPPELLDNCQKALAPRGGQVTPEFMRSQIEVGTTVCWSVKEVRADLARLRAVVADCAAPFGLAPIASSTHPFAAWADQRHTDKDRYNALAADLQMIAQRLLISGMHVHVGVEDDDMRIDLMNQASYFLPHLLALSTSSPFWCGRPTGLKSYRMTIFDTLPRTGLPEQFSSWAEYQRTATLLIRTGVIEDASKIWWDLRPSARFPTLEMRITDICPLLDDGVALAALFLCICRMLWRLRRKNQRWRTYAPFLLLENRWRAQRYGIDRDLIDFGKAEMVDFASLIDELLSIIRKDAEALDCVAEVEHIRTILARGTSAERQLGVYENALKAGTDEQTALRAVVDDLIVATVEGTAAEQQPAAACYA